MTQTTPPILIGTPLAFPFNQSVLVGCKIGPYHHGSDDWIVTAENPDQTTGPNLVAYKRTGGAGDYARIAAGPLTAIQLGDNILSSSFAYVFYRGTGTVIDIAYEDPDRLLNAVTFDMGSETFGSPNSTGITVPAGVSGRGLINLSMAVLGSGHLVVTYSQYDAKLYSITYSGSWGSPVEIDDGSHENWFFDNTVVDSGGNVGIWYGKGSGNDFRTGNKLYAIFNGTAVTSRVDTGIDAAQDRDPPISCVPMLETTSNSVVFPYMNAVKVGPRFYPAAKLLIGTPSTAPVFRVVVVNIITDSAFILGGDTTEFVNIVSNAAGTNFNVFFMVQINAGTYTVRQSTSGSLDGPWSAPNLYYNENAHPPIGAFLVGLAPIYSGSLPDDSIVVIIGAVVTSPGFFRGVLYTWQPGTPPPVTGATIAAVQTITGGSGSPTTVAITGPTPVSGTGGFSATPVAVGTYTLAQVPVPGFLPGPWVLSGTGGTLVGNVLTIADGDAPIVTIDNVFTPGALTVRCAPSRITVGVPYVGGYTVTGGVPPYTFVIITGTLPMGLTLNSTTGEISGTPTEPGPISITIQVTDSA